MSLVLAAIWLLGLFAAAPALRQSARYDFADRLRDALILGVAIPLALGAVHLFYPIACFAALLLCLAIADIRRREPRFVEENGRTNPPYILIAALLAVAWPQLMRPLLDGDSLSYHLPNAASWVQAHSIWTTTTQYWWYPPASELFAAALYAVGNPFALPWSGFCALALLGFRIATWAREAFGASPLLADALASATVTAYPLAIQGGTLQNDVWLAAFWLETLWLLRGASAEGAAAPTAAVTALIKPQGWLFAVIAMITGRASPRVWFAAAIVFGAWLIRNAILWKSAMISPAAVASYADVFSSTILGHGVAALWLLVTVTARISPFALFALCAALAAPLYTKDRRLGWAAFASVLVFLLLPFGYQTAVAQLATGASLRFAAPAIALGALLPVQHLRRFRHVAVALLALSTLFGIWYVSAVFWNDGSTHVALLAAIVGAGIAVAMRRPGLRWLAPAAIGLAVVITMHYAGRHPLDYYNDALRVDGTPPGVYRWISVTRPAAIGGHGLRLGVVNVLSPSTRTRDLPDDGPCAAASLSRVLLVAVAQSDLTRSVNLLRLQAARGCGRVLYRDPIAVVAAPPRRPLRFSQENL
ncbi:MAG TPA: hypothetical protein VGI19_10215 [Candidatus Cybelea sp.]